MKRHTAHEIRLAEHIVQAICHTPDDDESSSAHLQQLVCWHPTRQPVAMDVVLSHEIAKVIDAMQQPVPRQPVAERYVGRAARRETFRKRFVAGGYTALKPTKPSQNGTRQTL